MCVCVCVKPKKNYFRITEGKFKALKLSVINNHKNLCTYCNVKEQQNFKVHLELKGKDKNFTIKWSI